MNTKNLNADYPIPDPACDYSEIWHHSQQTNTELQKLLSYMERLKMPHLKAMQRLNYCLIVLGKGSTRLVD
jgi:hypothetical protein